MHAISQLVALCAASALAACSVDAVTIGPLDEDGDAPAGDGDRASGYICGNGCLTGALAYLKASNTGGASGDDWYGDKFGTSVALSADGSTLAVGAYIEDSAATGIDGDQGDNSAREAGAVYVFVWSGTTWTQQAYLKASNTRAGDYFGFSVALSADGSTLAVGAFREDSAATGIDGDQADDSAEAAGAVYVFTRSGTAWSQEAYVKASSTGKEDYFGASVALSADGSTLAVGAWGNGGVVDAGAAYVFTRGGAGWSQEAYVKGANTGAGDHFGWRVALSGDGSTLAVGAYWEDSAATGVNGNQADNSASSAGAVYVFARSGTAWSQEAYVKASNTGADDEFGRSVALSGDGSTLAVGAVDEDSAGTGIGCNPGDDSASRAGAVYVFARSGTAWSQEAYVKASNTDAGDQFGFSVALSNDGSTLAVGARYEDSAATGIGGNPSDNSTVSSGAVYVLTRSGATWSHQAYVKASNTGKSDLFGASVALSGDASMLAVGAPGEDSAATGVGGDQTNNSAIGAGAVYVYH